MRLDKFLANMGLGSRKDVKQLIKKGNVTINHSTVKDPKKHVNLDHDDIICNGRKVNYQPYVYFMMNKPKGVITATEDATQRTVLDLLAQEDKWLDLFPVGRLDKDTEGLLLITNDGQLAHDLLSPKKHVKKTYMATLSEPATSQDVNAFAHGLTLKDGYKTKPSDLIIPQENDGKTVFVTIDEGKYHQIKRMFAARNNRVLTLKRKAMGALTLDENLDPGDYRELTNNEFNELKMNDN